MKLEIAQIIHISEVERFKNSSFIRFFTRTQKQYNVVVNLSKNVAHDSGFNKDAQGRTILKGHKKGRYLAILPESIAKKYTVGQQLTYKEFSEIIPEQNYLIKGKK